MRSALGASRTRLARLALAESLLLSMVAGGLGLCLGLGLLKVFQGLAPTSIPKIEQASLDFRVFSVAAALSIACGIAVGLWPALSGLRTGMIPVGSRATGGLKPRARLALITTQITLTVALLGISGLLLHSLWNLIQVPLGFDAEQTVTMAVILNAAHYPNPLSQSALFEEVLNRVASSPGIVAAAWSNTFPLTMYANTSGMPVDGAATGRETAILRLRYVTPGYFGTFRIPMVKGRAFLPADRDEQPVAILSESAERTLFPGQSSIGHTIRPFLDETWHKVVGVVKDIRNAGLTRPGEPEVYLIRNRKPQTLRAGMIAIRTTLDSADAGRLLKQSLASVDPELPSEVRTVSDQVSGLTSRSRFLAVLLTTFAGLALIVAGTGLYAVSSFLVTQRTRDFGIRMALGASTSAISRQVASEAMYWIVAGTASGYLLAQFVARALTTELFQTSSTDLWSWIVTAVALSLALLFALIPPMRRAARVDPVIALRAE